MFALFIASYICIKAIYFDLSKLQQTLGIKLGKCLIESSDKKKKKKMPSATKELITFKLFNNHQSQKKKADWLAGKTVLLKLYGSVL